MPGTGWTRCSSATCRSQSEPSPPARGIGRDGDFEQKWAGAEADSSATKGTHFIQVYPRQLHLDCPCPLDGLHHDSLEDPLVVGGGELTEGQLTVNHLGDVAAKFGGAAPF